MSTVKETLTMTSGGLAIYSYPNPYLHTFCICLYVKGGPLYESPGENGISHFLEHIIFKNINHEMNGKLFAVLDRLGLSFNACTYREMIQFTITGPVKHFREAAEILSCAFCEIDLPEHVIDTERKRILAEIRECDEKKDLDYFSQKKVWHDTSLAQSIAGKKKNLKACRGAQLKKIHAQLMSTNNCFYYLTGAFTGDDVRYLKEMTEKHKKNTLSPARTNAAVLPEDFCRRKRTLHLKKGTAAELSFAFDFHADGHSKAARILLYDLLFSGDNSRIFQELSEKTGYIYSFDSHLEEYENACSLYLSFEISPDKMVKAARKVTGILQELKEGRNICLDYVLPEYVENAELELDSPESLNWTMAYEKHFLGQSFDSLEERSEVYRKVSKEEICRLAKVIFRPENLTLCCKGRKAKVPKDLCESVFSNL